MANALYDAGRAAFLQGDFGWDDADVRLIFIDEADDTIDLAADDNLDDRASAARVATSGSFASKTTTAGVADAADVTVNTVTGDVFESIDIYEHSGTETLEDAVAWMTEVLSHSDAPDLWGVFCGNPDDRPAIPAMTGNGPTSEANARYLVAVQPRTMLKLLIFLRQAMGAEGVIDAPLPESL